MEAKTVLVKIIVAVIIVSATVANVHAGDTWLPRTVTSYGDVGQFSSLALDAAGEVHISYYDQTNGDLKYITSATAAVSGSWPPETVDSYGEVGRYSDMAIDASGNVHISYYIGEYDNLTRRETGELRYATNASGSWVVQTVDSDGDLVGQYSAIAVDASGKVHISYCSSIHDYADTYYYRPVASLRYASNVSGSWVTEKVEQEGEMDEYAPPTPINSDIVLDASAKAHISYYFSRYDSESHLYSGDLKYATNASGSWAVSVVESGKMFSYPPIITADSSIARDASGKIHISYYVTDYDDDPYSYRPEGNLRYASNASGKWVTETLDDYQDAGQYSSIALDSSDKVHISYYSNTWDKNTYRYVGNLNYVTNASGEWGIQTVDMHENVGQYSAIAIDSSDKVHISYYDGTNGDLRHITNSVSLENGYLAASELWIRAVIHTEEKGEVDAVWKKGGEEVTAANDLVIWGYFYASSNDVSWGSENNPDLFVKIWFDHSGRLDVNFFHVSVPNIDVYSDYRYDGIPDEAGTTTTSKRYVKHYYQNGDSFIEVNTEDGISPEGYSQNDRPVGDKVSNDLRIGAIINLEEARNDPIDATWRFGGSEDTARGDHVIWGYFYASPHAVTWGSKNNPDLYVKIWFDVSGRIDVNYFHVSVPDIEVYTDYPDNGIYEQTGTTMETDRYTKHEFQRQEVRQYQ